MNLLNQNTSSVSAALRVRPPVACEDIYFDVVPHTNLLRWGNAVTPFFADYMFGCPFTQEQIFETSTKPYIDRFIRALDDISFVAFGSKYSGKTFTLFGPGVQCTDSAAFYGIYPRFATYLFSRFDASLFAGDNPQMKIGVSFIEIENFQMKNLLTNTVLTDHADSYIPGRKTLDFLNRIDYEQCSTARDMVNCLHVALNNRQIQSSHVIAEVIIEQPLLDKDGPFKMVKNSALFVEVGNTAMEHPMLLNPNNNSPVLLPEDRFMISALALSHGGRITNEFPAPDGNHLFNCLKGSFNGERCTLVFCCVAPSSIQVNTTNAYINELRNILDMRYNIHLNQVENLEIEKNQNLPGNKTNSLISEAESLLSKLSVTKSVSEEDQEKLKNWLHMKKECENDSLNAQSHGQLECIEEVTESEEEIASSNEKMSESPDSLDNSLSESDQEEGDSKVCQLDNSNFFSSLDNMCVQFNTFVDTFVDSFKSKTSLSPAKERKRDYSAARRGGMPELPTVDEFQTQINTSSESLEFGQNFNQYSQPSTSSSQGCIRKTLKLYEEHKSKNSSFVKGKTDKKIDEDQNIYISDTDSSSADEEIEMLPRGTNHRELVTSPTETKKKEKEEEEDNSDEDKYITWEMVNPVGLDDFDLFQWMKKIEEDIKKVRETWTLRINKTISVEQKGKEGQSKAREVELKKQMLFAVSGIQTFINMMKENLEIDGCEMDDPDCGFNHTIRWHRLSRKELMRHRSKLDASIKNKLATDEEIRDHLMADEMIETLDSSIEFLNYMILHSRPYDQKLPNTPVGKEVLAKFQVLTSLEMRNLMFKYFMKVVDLRENSKQMENTIADNEKKLELSRIKMMNLIRLVQHLRSIEGIMEPVNNLCSECAYAGRAHSPPTLALPEGSKSRRGPSIPQQNLSKLQVTKPAPPTKVTFKNNKLIIEKSNNENKH